MSFCIECQKEFYGASFETGTGQRLCSAECAWFHIHISWGFVYEIQGGYNMVDFPNPDM